MHLPRETTKFYVQEYRDITLNIIRQKKRLRNPNFEPFEAQNDLFVTIFGQNQANLRMERNQKFQIQSY